MDIRKYVENDKKEVVEVVLEILEEMFNGEPAEFEILKEFDVTKDYIKYLVAVDEGNIIATGALKKLSDDEVRLKRMYVASEYRGRGTAQKILDQLMLFAKEQGFKQVIFSTYPIMKDARKFHKKNGFMETENEDPYKTHLLKKL